MTKSTKLTTGDTSGYDALSRSDRKNLQAIMLIRSELADLGGVARHIDRLAERYAIYARAENEALCRSVLIDDDEIETDLKAEYAERLCEMDESKAGKQFLRLHDKLSMDGRKHLWAPDSDFSNIQDYQLPFWTGPEDDD